jgi:hypothetical protein
MRGRASGWGGRLRSPWRTWCATRGCGTRRIRAGIRDERQLRRVGKGGVASHPSWAAAVRRAARLCCPELLSRDTDRYGPRRRKARSHARRSPRDGERSSAQIAAWSQKVVRQPLVTTSRERATSTSANRIETRDPTLKRARSTTATQTRRARDTLSVSVDRNCRYPATALRANRAEPRAGLTAARHGWRRHSLPPHRSC